jgi:hypothetical protein
VLASYVYTYNPRNANNQLCKNMYIGTLGNSFLARTQTAYIYVSMQGLMPPHFVNK